ncbi:MAG: ABC transporter transmembrane domain-containing protein, partial [Chloroflexi bacterium]|nr:ABC transporter transmembrane domain-containing protein [Chloroflexota bacterium]
MFTHLQNLSLRFFDNNSVGKLMSRVQNDVQELEQLITSGFLNIITDAITIIGIIIIMLVMNWQLALVSLISIPLMVLFMTIWRKYASLQFLKTRQTIAVVNARLQQNISGVRVIQSFAKEESNFEDFDTVNKGNLNTNIAASRLTALMQPMVEILIAITTASIIVVGGYQIINGQIGVGVIIGFLMYITRFFNPIRELSQEYSTLQRAMASGGRIFELLDTKPEIEDKNNAIDLPPIRGSIQFSNVNFSYRDDIEVLHNINISISPGET